MSTQRTAQSVQGARLVLPRRVAAGSVRTKSYDSLSASGSFLYVLRRMYESPLKNLPYSSFGQRFTPKSGVSPAVGGRTQWRLREGGGGERAAGITLGAAILHTPDLDPFLLSCVCPLRLGLCRSKARRLVFG
jgi:hypothetical protein